MIPLKIRVQNVLKNNFHSEKTDRYKDYIDNKIEKYILALEKADSSDQKEALESKIKHKQSKKEKYEQIEKQLEDSDQSRISLTDSYVRLVVLHRNIVNIGYCIQASCDAQHIFL